MSMDKKIKEALSTMWRCLNLAPEPGGSIALREIQEALEAAQEAQRDIEAIEAYGRAYEVYGPSIFFSNGRWRGHITDHIDSLRDGDSYAEVHSQLAKWCRKELAK
jgi:hypothetical protein